MILREEVHDIRQESADMMLARVRVPREKILESRRHCADKHSLVNLMSYSRFKIEKCVVFSISIFLVSIATVAAFSSLSSNYFQKFPTWRVVNNFSDCVTYDVHYE
jgi:hypothetical protein